MKIFAFYFFNRGKPTSHSSGQLMSFVLGLLISTMQSNYAPFMAQKIAE